MIKAPQRPTEQFPPWLELAILAGVSLELTDQEIAAAITALTGATQRDDRSDFLHARLLELAELVLAQPSARTELREACASLDLVAERAQLERRHGRGFVALVASMGLPAAAVLERHLETGKR